MLEVLSEHLARIPIVRIVAASSGALNGAVYATGIRYGSEHLVARRLVELWLHDAKWHNVLKVADCISCMAWGWARRTACFRSWRARGGRSPPGAAAAIALELVLTLLRGEAGDIAGTPATTFEHVAGFADEQFDTKAGRAEGLRRRARLGGIPAALRSGGGERVGSCIDGGVVNNTPIKRAIQGGGVERVIVVTPEPLRSSAPEPLRGTKLITQIAEIVINERLYRDLRDAEAINDYLRQLDALAESGVPLRRHPEGE